MAINVNLLPVDLSPQSSTAKVSNILKTAAIYGAVVFLVLGAIAGGFFAITASRIANFELQQTSLKTSIEALSQSEQSLVLVRDRISKVNSVLGDTTTNQALAEVTILSSALPPTSEVQNAELTDQLTKIAIVARSTGELAGVLAALVAQDYDQVNLKSINFNPISGYLVSLEVK